VCLGVGEVDNVICTGEQCVGVGEGARLYHLYVSYLEGEGEGVSI